MSEATQDQDRADALRVIEGDVEAFDGIVHRWQRPLVNLAYRYCRHPGRAEEMAQEAFVRAFRFLKRWRADAAFSTWLFALAINVYRSEMRRMRPQELPLSEDRDLPDDSDTRRDQESGEKADVVRRTVSTLPAKYRDVVILFYFLEMDIAETARCLGLPTGTVKARLHRARSLLERKLSGFGFSPRRAEAT